MRLRRPENKYEGSYTYNALKNGHVTVNAGRQTGRVCISISTTTKNEIFFYITAYACAHNPHHDVPLHFTGFFKLHAQEYAATATPFEKDGGISYDISIPDKIFTIRAMPLKDGGTAWVDYYSAEPTELSEAAGKGIQSVKN